jgi:hypothetical protein
MGFGLLLMFVMFYGIANLVDDMSERFNSGNVEVHDGGKGQAGEIGSRNP